VWRCYRDAEATRIVGDIESRTEFFTDLEAHEISPCSAEFVAIDFQGQHRTRLSLITENVFAYLKGIVHVHLLCIYAIVLDD
jgi:hypothetical protein